MLYSQVMLFAFVYGLGIMVGYYQGYGNRPIFISVAGWLAFVLVLIIFVVIQNAK